VNRKLRKLRREAGFAYIHHRGAQAGPQDMEWVFQVNRQARHTYLYRTHAERDFQRDLAGVMAARGMLELYFLFIHDVPVAFYYGFWRRHTFAFWRTGFDPAFASYSPGKVLLYLLLQEGFANAMCAMDFLSGDESYKRDWQVETRPYTHLRLVRRRLLPLAVYVWLPRLKRAVRDFLRRHPALHPLLEAIIRATNRRQNRAGETAGGQHGAD
jgi:CelD/BcsL family acetyltransferase involved in cellulose biosynthesis